MTATTYLPYEPEDDDTEDYWHELPPQVPDHSGEPPVPPRIVNWRLRKTINLAKKLARPQMYGGGSVGWANVETPRVVVTVGDEGVTPPLSETMVVHVRMTLNTGTARAIVAHGGGRSVEEFIEGAVRNDLRRLRVGQFLDDLDDQLGPVDEALIETFDRLFDEAESEVSD